MQSVKQNLLAAFRYLLKPLVRLAIKNAVSLPEFSDALKSAYVDVAARQLKASGTEPTEQGIAFIANVEIAVVRAVLSTAVVDRFGAEAQESNPLPTILEKWHTDPNYTGPYGVVRDISFAPIAGISGSSFTELVAKYCAGPNSPEVLLDELIRTDCVQEMGNGFYRAVKRLYVPDPLSTQSVLWFARVVHNLCETLERNLSEKVRGGGLMERTIYAVHGISRKSLGEFDKFLRQRGQHFADDIDNWLSDRDEEGRADGVKTGVGVYQYIVNEEDEQALSKELQH